MSQSSNSLVLRAARLEELEQLSELCLRSKAVWGYDEAFLAACRAELTFRPAELSATKVQVAECGGRIVGVAQVSVVHDTAHLERLFVDPASLRSGAGRELFAWARAEAQSAGARALVIESDPGAAAFYRRMGASDDGVVPSASIPGRTIPRLKLPLA